MRDTFFLWHLEHVGVLRRAGDAFDAPLWAAAEAAEPVTVALVDTGIDTGHPNLAAAVAGPQVDFGVRREGAVFAPVGAAVDALRRELADSAPSDAALRAALGDVIAEVSTQAGRLGLDVPRLAALVAEAEAADPADRPAAVGRLLDALRTPAPAPVPGADDAAPSRAAELAALDLAADAAGDIAALAAELAAGPAVLPCADISRYFGAHGTASAGLVCGRPAADPSAFGALPYYGVNPFGRIRSYATPYSHEIRPVLCALLAAYLSGAEVILLPRGVPDIAARAALPPSALRATRIETEDATVTLAEDQANLARLRADAALLEALLRAVAKRRYLIVAAGNEGWTDRVGYPASALVDTPEALIVGAETADRVRAPYSNGRDLGDRVLLVVSDDAEQVDADGLRIDPTRARGWDFDLAAHAQGAEPAAMSPWAPLTTDLRGGYGYAASSAADAPDYEDGIERPALYTLFGGTSAAAAIAAGLVSVLVQSGRLDRAGGAPAAAIAEAIAREGRAGLPG